MTAHLLYALQWQNIMTARDQQIALDANVKMQYDKTAIRLKDLHIGTTVRVQDPIMQDQTMVANWYHS